MESVKLVELEAPRTAHIICNLDADPNLIELFFRR